jgi:hypothetical protein
MDPRTGPGTQQHAARDGDRSAQDGDGQRRDRDIVLMNAFLAFLRGDLRAGSFQHLHRCPQQDEPARDLEGGDGDAEEVKDRQAADGKHDQDDKGHAASPAGHVQPVVGCVRFRHRQKRRNGGERVQDGKQSTEAEK